MKAIGLDTCIVLRLLVGEPEEQAASALKFVEDSHYGGVSLCVSDMVVGEVYHALIYHYDVPKLEAIHSLRDFLYSPMITTTGHALSVLTTYKGKGVGLVDQLIRMDFLNFVYEIVTFDRNFARLPNVRRLSR